jgi:hypothetical protein
MTTTVTPQPAFKEADAAQVTDAALGWLREALEDGDLTVEDNFLAAGGHSMMAIQMRAWLAETYGLLLDLPSLFQQSLGDAVSAALPAA